MALEALFEHRLPPHLGCAELYLDRERFKPVESIEDARIGDLVWFGIRNALQKPEEVVLRYNERGELVNWRDFPVRHVAVHTGAEEAGVPLLLHATFMNGGKNAIWPLTEFDKHPRYSRLYGVTRLAMANANIQA